MRLAGHMFSKTAFVIIPVMYKFGVGLNQYLFLLS